MKRRLPLLGGIGLLLLTFGVAYSTPASELIEAPFGATGVEGDRIVSEYIVAQVHDTELADEVQLGEWRGTTAGVWLVVDVTLEARLERTGVHAEVLVGGVTYRSSDRADSDTVDGPVIDPGFPVRGVILVELPGDVRDQPGAASAVVRIADSFDSRLSSIVEVPIDLTDLRQYDRVELVPVRPGAL
jgi:hypothetical protein